MTAEIAVLNREAVALAADSAVTLSTSTGPKVIPSANKIFELSTARPVGVMIYGGAEHLDVPWETVVNLFREQLDSAEDDRLEDYAQRFLTFLSESELIVRSDAQDRSVQRIARAVYEDVLNDLLTLIEQRLEDYDVNEDDLRLALEAVLEANIRIWRDSGRLPGLPERFGTTAKRRHRAAIAEARDAVFEELPFSPRARRDLNTLTGLIFEREGPNAVDVPYSGVVVAGFGRSEIFPQIRHYRVFGVVAGRLRFTESSPASIDPENDATIAPFAQREMVDAFIEGLEPGYGHQAEDETRETLDVVVADVLTDSGLDDDARATLTESFRTTLNERLVDLSDRLRQLRLVRNVYPILEVVSALPKDELAAMAESLVNLTSFKRKVSSAAETVGGPIDVAVISRSDGFVWIKRKQYFSRELNVRHDARMLGANNA